MPTDENVALYGASYGNFATRLYGEIRREAFGQDIGQTSWLSADEQDQFIAWLEQSAQSRLLDVACGSGGPTLRIAASTGASVVGVDIHSQAIAQARALAASQGRASARFETLDAGGPLPFDDGSFDAVLCIDAINHLPDRARTLAEWRRVLVPGGRLVFTDPIIVTGALTDREMRLRSSIGFFLFVPLGLNEKLLEEAGFVVRRAEDRTDNMARMARRWFEARSNHETDLRRIEGDEAYEGQQRFLEVTATLAAERRLSRFAFLATARSA